MYTLARSIGLTSLLQEQAPMLLVSFLIAEAFYKFHSFTLECLAFLATWFLIDVSVQNLRKRLQRKSR
jgi:hypothetical protein